MSEKTKKILWRIFQVLGMIIINGATIAFIVMNCVNISANKFDISYWDALSSKPLYNTMTEILNENVANKEWLQSIVNKLPEYHWYNKFLVYFFILLGWIGTFFWIKRLYKNHKELKIMKLQTAEQIKVQEAIELKKLRAKADSDVLLSKEEMKELERLSKK